MHKVKVLKIENACIICCLFRWNFVVHGCIDRYSRLVTHLEIHTNNLASTAYECFRRSCLEYGIPGKICIDGSGEFNHIENFMNRIDGERRCFRGKSVHNVRIERHWRDTRKKVIDKYITLFKCMENHGVLYIDNEIHMFCLHYVFKRRIQEDLSVWRNSYKVHGIRT